MIGNSIIINDCRNFSFGEFKMQLLILLILLLVLLAILFGIYKSIVAVHRSLGKAFQSPKIVWLWRIVLAVASCAVGVFFVVFTYNLSETKRLNGIPLPWAAWEKVNGNWIDFISPVSLVFAALDFIFGIGITHFLVAFLLFAKNKFSNKQIENA